MKKIAVDHNEVDKRLNVKLNITSRVTSADEKNPTHLHYDSSRIQQNVRKKISGSLSETEKYILAETVLSQGYL